MVRELRRCRRGVIQLNPFGTVLIAVNGFGQGEEIFVVIVLFHHTRLIVGQLTGASGDVTFDFHSRRFDIFRQTSDFEHGLLVPTRCDNVRIGILLNAFNRRTFRSNYQTNHAVRNTNLNGDLLQIARGRGIDQTIVMEIGVAAAACTAVR